MRSLSSATLLLLAIIAGALASAHPGRAAQPTRAVSIDAQYRYTCAVMEAGPLQCWGENPEGALGDGTKVHRNAPVYVVGGQGGIVDVTTADIHTCALGPGGSVQCWGWNGEGELGDGTGVSSLTPVNVLGLQSGVTEIESGELHSCAVLEGGEVKCWGYNAVGQLGDGTTEDRLEPVVVQGITDAVALAGGESDLSCALRQGGGVSCWGSNFAGQLGAGLPDSFRTTPVAVAGLTSGVRSISAGGRHACAVKSNSHVVCWGGNENGQLGDGTFNASGTPVEVAGLSNAESVAAGGAHTCVVTTEGAAKCWGAGNQGQLGDGSTSQRSGPVQVAGLTGGVAQLTAGSAHTCALLDDGSVKCWGWNGYGSLGNGTNDQSSVPVNVALKPPGPFFIQGDVDCSGQPDAHDALAELRFLALQEQPQAACPDIGTGPPANFGDVNCSNLIDTADPLDILRALAGLPYQHAPSCPEIGQPL